MKNTASPSFIARVRASMSDLHPTERRLAETLLSFPGDMAGYTATEVAEVAGVSNATVSRFVRKIGYASYEEARRAVRDAGQKGSALLRFGTADVDAKQAIDAHLDQSHRTLDKTYDELDISLVDEIAQALHAAPRVWLAGYRAGHPLATYLAWQIGQVLPAVRVIPKPGETLAETAATFSDEDVLILLGLRRSTRAAQGLVNAALGAGVQVGVIGDVAELLAMPVRWSFACSTASMGPLLNHTSVIALCNLIATRALELSGPDGRTRMERIESFHDQLGEL
ncbi:MAG: MurR/RpiR family transcriptional regulator [Pseudomonadota bacterium]